MPKSWCVGDKLSDMHAARAAGVGICILYDPSGSENNGDFRAVSTLAEVIPLLESAG
jgi:phosphoglycolate phosphatase-like HAD superfamily hydrolase